MILLMAGSQDIRAFSSMLQFGRQLVTKGLDVGIDERSAPEAMETTQKYEAIGLLRPIQAENIERILIVGASDIDDRLLSELHGFGIAPNIPVTAIDHFKTSQGIIGTQSKLAFALGFEPVILNLSDHLPGTFLETTRAPLLHSGFDALPPHEKPTVLIYVPKNLLKGKHVLSHLDMLANSPDIDVNVVTQARGKERITRSRFRSISTYSLSELGPETLARMTDMLVFYGENIPGERMANLALEVMGKGGAVLDCTTRAAFVTAGAPVVRGPLDVSGLGGFLRTSVFPNITAIRQQMDNTPWVQKRSIGVLLDAIGLAAPEPNTNSEKSRTLFIPTNGVGLGHAQRCSQIAASMSPGANVGFAAFPSCVPMLQSKGFDCLTLVQKSDQHRDPYANDLMNYRRLQQTVAETDHLVFDGGYVFNSIYRTILENRLSATWIRRGLWQAGQLDRTPLERERAFGQVIIPQEAFDELNSDYSFGPKIHKVGPIVQQSTQKPKDKARLRSKLKDHFGVDFGRLVVSMLGGGVAADRTTQLQIISSQLDNRPDCLHLVVVWPNASISPNLLGWNNTHVVRSRNAMDLCQISDFVISASGYNSFHELLYHRVPTIFVPQMAGFMDDQERRALAASDRGLATTVLADELLSLKHRISQFLDGPEIERLTKALAAEELPEIGNATAAKLIERMTK